MTETLFQALESSVSMATVQEQAAHGGAARGLRILNMFSRLITIGFKAIDFPAEQSYSLVRPFHSEAQRPVFGGSGRFS